MLISKSSASVLRITYGVLTVLGFSHYTHTHKRDNEFIVKSICYGRNLEDGFFKCISLTERRFRFNIHWTSPMGWIYVKRWLKKWLNTEQATSHYWTQWWPCSARNIHGPSGPILYECLVLLSGNPLFHRLYRCILWGYVSKTDIEKSTSSEEMPLWPINKTVHQDRRLFIGNNELILRETVISELRIPGPCDLYVIEI